MASPTYPSKPFEQTALGLSGGGYRAASFHLGTLSYLRHVLFRGRPLLECVKVISTISGGSFTGVMYAHSLWESKTSEDDVKQQSDAEFAAFYHRLKDFMDKVDLIKAGLDKLQDDREWRDGRRRNVINSLAKVYQEAFFGHSNMRTFDIFYWGRTHLEEVMFNATEFDRGLPFRFQKTLDNRGIIGNYFRRVPEIAAREIRLGDIIASSSCFPAGFEPLSFPHDYMGDKNTGKHLRMLTDEASVRKNAGILGLERTEEQTDEDYEKYLKRHTYSRPMAVMDGGIVDNQGIESIIWSEKRRDEEEEQQGQSTSTVRPEADGEKPEKDREIDLIIISDVASPFLDPLELADRQEEVMTGLQKTSISRINLRVVWFGFIALIMLIPVFLNWMGVIYLQNWQTNLGLILGTSSGTIALLLLWLSRYIEVSLIGKQLPAFYKPYLPVFTKLRVFILEPMLRDRISSVLKMVNDIFLKQIRRLTYYKIYQNEDWEYRRFSNLVYKLRPKQISRAKEDFQMPGEAESDGLKRPQFPSEAVQTIAENASNMGTTLWFTPQDRGWEPEPPGKDGKVPEKHGDRLKDLVTNGQFTICLNLLEYLLELQGVPEQYAQLEDKVHLDRLEQQLRADWKRFNEEPYWLYDWYENHRMETAEGT